MNKNKLIRSYLWGSVVIMLVFMIVQYVFTKNISEDPMLEFYGSIETSLFQFSFENLYGVIDVFNTPLVLYIVFTVLSLGVAIYSLREPIIEKKLLQEVVVYNVVLSILMVVSSIVYMVLIPEIVNGNIVNGMFMTGFEVQNDEFVRAFNFTYTFMIIYLGLNIASLMITKEKNFKSEKTVEELDSAFID